MTNGIVLHSLLPLLTHRLSGRGCLRPPQENPAGSGDGPALWTDIDQFGNNG